MIGALSLFLLNINTFKLKVMCMRVSARVQIDSEYNGGGGVGESVLPCVSQDQTQVVGFGIRHLYPLSCLANPSLVFLF